MANETHDTNAAFPANGGRALVLKGADDESSAIEIFNAIRKHLWLVVSVAALTLFAAATYGLSRTKIYRSTAVIQINPKPPTPLGNGVEGVVELGTSGYWASLEYYNTQHRLIRSMPVALPVVKELGLAQDPGFIANIVPAPARTETPTSDEKVAEMLMARLAVDPVKESRLVQVSYDDADKARASRVLDAVLRAYVAHNVNKTMESTSSAVEWLGEQLEHLRSELAESELALHEYKLQKQIASLGIDDQTTILKSKMAQLSGVRTEVQARIQEASARLAQIKRIDVNKPEEIPQMELLRSVELEKLLAIYMEVRGDRDSLIGSGKGPQHPEVLATEAKLRSGAQALSAVVKNIEAGARGELAALRQQEGGLSSLLDGVEQDALDLNLMEIEYSRLKRTKENNEKLYGLVLERSKETSLTQMLKVNNVQTIAPPTTSDSPVEPRLSLILGVGSMMGLLLGFGAAFLREKMDRSIRSSEALESRLGLLTLGEIPHEVGQRGSGVREGRRVKAERRAGGPADVQLDLYVQERPTGAFAEAVRTIRTNLLFMSPDKRFKRLLVTSPSPSEGKTTVGSNLAIAMAQAGQRVILVDCDLRRPRLERIFPNLPTDRATVSECLLDPSSLHPDRLGSGIGNLSVLTAGPTPPNPTELLHSDAFRALLDQLSSSFDLVLLDSPPLIVTDAAILATRVDGIILVVRAFKTHYSAAQTALRALNDVGGNVVGAVLNDARAGRAGYGYGYGYGYRGTSADPAQEKSDR